jgi:hypothetical protein
MGMFNRILADLTCSARQGVARDAEIQIKWQSRDALALTAYRVGDVLEHIDPQCESTRVRTDYICHICSKHTAGKNGACFIRVEDQSRHMVFVRIDQGKIEQVLSEEDFAKTGEMEFRDHL